VVLLTLWAGPPVGPSLPQARPWHPGLGGSRLARPGLGPSGGVGLVPGLVLEPAGGVSRFGRATTTTTTTTSPLGCPGQGRRLSDSYPVQQAQGAGPGEHVLRRLPDHRGRLAGRRNRNGNGHGPQNTHTRRDLATLYSISNVMAIEPLHYNKTRTVSAFNI